MKKQWLRKDEVKALLDSIPSWREFSLKFEDFRTVQATDVLRGLSRYKSRHGKVLRGYILNMRIVFDMGGGHWFEADCPSSRE
jgi:hypothetical protein